MVITPEPVPHGERGLHKGPQVGGYDILQVVNHDLAVGEVSLFRFPMPYAGRIVETAVLTAGKTAAPTYAINNGSGDVVIARVWPAVDTAEILTPTSSTVLVEGRRTFAKGNNITVTLNSVTTGALGDYVVMITVYCIGHVVAFVEGAEVIND